MSSAIDNYTVTSQQTERALLAAFTAKRPVFLWGPPGIGKSDVVAGVAKKLGGAIIDLRLSQMEPTDIRGIPFFNKDLGKMDWAPPIELPDEEFASQYPIVVLFLDELNSAPPAVQAATYQLILNGRVGKYVLPKNVVMVAAGNRESDKGVTYRMPMPLANRFIHIEMKPDFNSWQEWAVKNSVHKDVVGYLSFAKQDMYDFDAKSATRSFATPRSWVFVSDLLKSEESMDRDTLYTLVAGAVGQGLAAKFTSHRQVVGQLPEPMDILEGRETEMKIKEISAMYSLTISMCYEMRDMVENKTRDKKQMNEIFNNFFTFIMNNFETELVILGSRIALRQFDLDIEPTRLPVFPEFNKRYGKLVLNSVK